MECNDPTYRADEFHTGWFSPFVTRSSLAAPAWWVDPLWGTNQCAACTGANTAMSDTGWWKVREIAFKTTEALRELEPFQTKEQLQGKGALRSKEIVEGRRYGSSLRCHGNDLVPQTQYNTTCTSPAWRQSFLLQLSLFLDSSVDFVPSELEHVEYLRFFLPLGLELSPVASYFSLSFMHVSSHHNWLFAEDFATCPSLARGEQRRRQLLLWWWLGRGLSSSFAK